MSSPPRKARKRQQQHRYQHKRAPLTRTHMCARCRSGRPLRVPRHRLRTRKKRQLSLPLPPSRTNAPARPRSDSCSRSHGTHTCAMTHVVQGSKHNLELNGSTGSYDLEFPHISPHAKGHYLKIDFRTLFDRFCDCHLKLTSNDRIFNFQKSLKYKMFFHPEVVRLSHI